MKMASGGSASGISVSMLYMYTVCENEDDFPKRLICLTKLKERKQSLCWHECIASWIACRFTRITTPLQICRYVWGNDPHSPLYKFLQKLWWDTTFLRRRLEDHQIGAGDTSATSKHARKENAAQCKPSVSCLVTLIPLLWGITVSTSNQSLR